MTIASRSIAVLAIQVALVSSIAGKYLYERWSCPRVWLPTLVVDPELPMRGRYLALNLPANACAGVHPKPQQITDFTQSDPQKPQKLVPFYPEFPARLSVKDNTLIATGIGENESRSNTVWVASSNTWQCQTARLRDPVDFFVPEKADLTLPTAAQFSHPDSKKPVAHPELWVEVTVPPVGPPRPIALAIKSAEGHWQPLNER